jgi:N-acetylglutamate synthase-like GNAT family acetyltransferase
MTLKREYTENISFRPVKEQDYNFLYKLHVATMKDYVRDTWGWDEKFQQDMFKKNFNPIELEIITFKKKDIGVISIEDRQEDVLLRSIEIAPEHQKKGLGTHIVQAVLNNAARKSKPVFLYVLKVNPAQKFYERLGFERVSETTTHFVMKAQNILEPQSDT